MTYNICTSQVLPKVYTTIHRYSRNPDGWKPDLSSYILHSAYAFGCQFGQTDHSPLFIAFWIHNFSNSPIHTFSTLFMLKSCISIRSFLEWMVILHPLFFQKNMSFWEIFIKSWFEKLYFFPFLLYLVGKSVKFVT